MDTTLRTRAASRRARLLAGALAGVTVLTLAACSGRGDPKTSPTPSPSPVGKPVTVTVRAADPIRVDVPGVGTLTGPKGAVTGDGSIVLQPVAGQPTLPAGMRVTGNGVDVTFTGTKLAKPLTLTFGKGAGADELPVDLHQGADGQWEARKAAVAGGQTQVTTGDFSIHLPGAINPATWAKALWAKIESGAAGRTDPIRCSGEPEWMTWSSPGDQVHACATTSTAKGTDWAELQLKSNRGVTLEVTYPRGAAYVSVQDQPAWLRKAMAAAFGYTGQRVVLLPAGDTMRAGWARPDKRTGLVITVSGRTGRAAMHTVAQDAIDFIAGWATDKNAYAFGVYMWVECASGFSTSTYHLSPGNLLDFLTCVGKRAAEAVHSPKIVAKYASKYGADPTDIKSLQAATKTAARQWKVFSIIAPALQLSWGSFFDGLQNAMTQGSSDTVTATLEPVPAPPPPPRTTTPAPTTAAPAPDGGPTCRQFLLAGSDDQQKAMWAAAADAAHRPQVASWGGLMNGVSVCQANPARSLVSVAKVVSPY